MRKNSNPFFLWSKNGTGLNARLEQMQTYYADLAASCLAVGRHQEAEIFEDMIKELKQLSQEVKKLSEAQQLPEEETT